LDRGILRLTETKVEEAWEYADADTQYHVHGIHPYPARMIPQIANRLIREQSASGQTVLDPFCGSGGVLTEALLLGRNAVGVDINPLAALIARVKTTPLPTTQLEQGGQTILGNVRTKIKLLRTGQYKGSTLYFDNIYHWFSKDVVQELAIIKEQIDATFPSSDVATSSLRDFFLVIFSYTIRKTSNIDFDDNPYFIRALTEEDLKKHSPDVLATFEKQITTGIDRVKEFTEICPTNVKARILLADSRSLPLEDSSVNLVVTSPPYGEESHTMSYSRFAKLSLMWMGMTSNSINLFVTHTLGGKVMHPRPYSELLDKTVKQVSRKNKTRAHEMFSFFWDYAKCISQLHRVLTKNGFCCIVIGDRSAAGLSIANGELTKEIAKLAGFEHVTTYTRHIPKKVLPRRDYKVELINKENIIVLQKI
jgi:site-specific DNA-methyltransferase (cytosine-N4-specific)